MLGGDDSRRLSRRLHGTQPQCAGTVHVLLSSPAQLLSLSQLSQRCIAQRSCVPQTAQQRSRLMQGCPARWRALRMPVPGARSPWQHAAATPYLAWLQCPSASRQAPLLQDNMSWAMRNRQPCRLCQARMQLSLRGERRSPAARAMACTCHQLHRQQRVVRQQERRPPRQLIRSPQRAQEERRLRRL